MTRKDYKKFAKMLRNCIKVRPLDSCSGEQLGEHIALNVLECEISTIFSEDNPCFDRQRFMNAVYHGKGI